MTRVLVVDDEIAILEGLSAYIERPNVEVEIASSLDEARRRLRAHNFDVIFSDLRVSYPFGEEGLDLFRISRTSNLGEFVLITGFATPEVEDCIRRRGATFLTKPLDLRKIDGIIASAAERSSKRSSLTRVERGVERSDVPLRARFEPVGRFAKVPDPSPSVTFEDEETRSARPIVYVF